MRITFLRNLVKRSYLYITRKCYEIEGKLNIYIYMLRGNFRQCPNRFDILYSLQIRSMFKLSLFVLPWLNRVYFSIWLYVFFLTLLCLKTRKYVSFFLLMATKLSGWRMGQMMTATVIAIFDVTRAVIGDSDFNLLTLLNLKVSNRHWFNMTMYQMSIARWLKYILILYSTL